MRYHSLSDVGRCYNCDNRALLEDGRYCQKCKSEFATRDREVALERMIESDPENAAYYDPHYLRSRRNRRRRYNPAAWGSSAWAPHMDSAPVANEGHATSLNTSMTEHFLGPMRRNPRGECWDCEKVTQLNNAHLCKNCNEKLLAEQRATRNRMRERWTKVRHGPAPTQRMQEEFGMKWSGIRKRLGSKFGPLPLARRNPCGSCGCGGNPGLCTCSKPASRLRRFGRRNPWSASDVSRFNKSCASRAACRKKWPRIANAVLKKYGDDGRAIRIANWQTKRMGLRRRNNPCQRCGEYSHKKPLCRKCYYGDIGKSFHKTCQVRGCKRPSFGQPKCKLHYYGRTNPDEQLRKGINICAEDGCNKPVMAGDAYMKHEFCAEHEDFDVFYPNRANPSSEQSILNTALRKFKIQFGTTPAVKNIREVSLVGEEGIPEASHTGMSYGSLFGFNRAIRIVSVFDGRRSTMTVPLFNPLSSVGEAYELLGSAIFGAGWRKRKAEKLIRKTYRKKIRRRRPTGKRFI